MIQGTIKPLSGKVYIDGGLTIACAQQTVPREKLDTTVRDFFSSYFHGEEYELDRAIKEALEVVQLTAASEKKIGDFSGGQQARLLLASALISDPDILLLDEPTNNLDAEGIGHLMMYLMSSDKNMYRDLP